MREPAPRFRRWRADGWPYCPRCDEDELYSLTDPPSIETICGCYRCGPWPIVVCPRCADTGVEPGTIVIAPGEGFGFNSLDPDPLDRGSYVPCKACGDRLGNGARP